MTTLIRVLLRELTPADVTRVVELTRDTRVFRDEEIVIAEEVVIEAVKTVGADTADTTRGMTDLTALIALTVPTTH